MAKNDVLLLDSLIEKSKAEYLRANDGSELFELFSFDQLLKDYDLSLDELDEGWTDGSNDGGIDGLFLFIDGQSVDQDLIERNSRREPSLSLHIFACRRSNAFEQAPLNSLHASLSELFDLRKADHELTYPFSQRILDRRALFRDAFVSLADRRPKLDVFVYYCCRGDTGTLADNLTSRGAQIEETLRSLFSDVSVRFQFVGAAELLELARRQKTYSLRLRYLETFISREGDNYVVLSPLAKYFDFISDENGKLRRYLFDSNVRDFLGFGRVSTDILETLRRKSDPGTEDFWWLNNGITILATHATVVGKDIAIENVQIVNGLQTTETIHRYFSSEGDQDDQRAILVKIILSADEITRARIVKATNYQNAVEIAAIRGLDKIQFDIEQLLLDRGLYYDRRRNFYRNQGKSADKIISMPYMAAAVRAVALGDPAASARQRSKSLRNDETYNQVFNNGWNLNAYVASLEITLAAEDLVRSKYRSDVPPIAIAHYVAYVFATRLIGKRKYKPDEVAQLADKRPTDADLESIISELREAALSYHGGPHARRYNGIPLDRAFIEWFASRASTPDTTAG